MLDTGARAPAWNMALDDVLLHGDGPTLRLYAWSPPGLSLGYFQPFAPFAAVPGDHHVVRRRTGGGAIYHDDEITFALTVAAAALPGDVAASYVLLHGAVRRALASVGVETRLVDCGDGGCSRARPTRPWCFAQPGPGDLVLACNGRKIVGSAQRRIRAPRPRILHHGSIVLSAPAATPFCGAVADVADPRAVEQPLRSALVAEIAAALGLQAQPAAAPTPAEIAAAERDCARMLHPAAGQR